MRARRSACPGSFTARSQVVPGCTRSATSIPAMVLHFAESRSGIRRRVDAGYPAVAAMIRRRVRRSSALVHTPQVDERSVIRDYPRRIVHGSVQKCEVVHTSEKIFCRVAGQFSLLNIPQELLGRPPGQSVARDRLVASASSVEDA